MSSQKQSYPRVGVGVVLFCVQTGEILVGKRKGSHGSGQWALPGGALEWKETSSSCAKRELREETGIDLNEVWHEEENAQHKENNLQHIRPRLGDVSDEQDRKYHKERAHRARGATDGLLICWE